MRARTDSCCRGARSARNRKSGSELQVSKSWQLFCHSHIVADDGSGSFRSSDKSQVANAFRRAFRFSTSTLQVNRTSSSTARKKVMTLKEGPIEKKDGIRLVSVPSTPRLTAMAQAQAWDPLSTLGA